MAQLEELLGIGLPHRHARRIDDDHVVQVQAQVGDFGPNALLVAEQNGLGDPLVGQDLAGTQDLARFALGENHPFRRALRLVDHDAHDLVRFAQTAAQLLLILAEVHRLLCHAAVHRRLRHRRGHRDQHPLVERLRNDVVASEFDSIHAVGAQHGIRHVLLGQCRQRPRGGQLHRLVDGLGSHVQRPAEDEGEAQHVVHLVGAIGAAGRDDRIRARLDGRFVRDLGVRVGQREDHRIGGHGLQHLGGDHVAHREPHEHVRVFHGLGQRAAVRLRREALHVGVHAIGAALVDHPQNIAHDDVPLPGAQLHVVRGTRQRRRPRPAEYDPHFADLLAGQLHRIQQRRPRDDRRAVLIVVEDRDLHGALQLRLDHEALRRLDVLQVDAPKGRLEQLAGAHHFARDLRWPAPDRRRRYRRSA